jgi:endo-1,4-beta-xylanase
MRRYLAFIAVIMLACTRLPGGESLDPTQITDPLHRSLVEETRALSPQRILTQPACDDNLKAFDFQTVGGGATRTDVDVEGQLFRRAMRIVTEKKKQEWMTHIQWWIPKTGLKAGDVIYVTAMVRFVKARDGKGQGEGRLYATQEVKRGAKEGSRSLYANDFAIPGGQQWHRIHLPMTVSHDFGDEGLFKMMFTFAHQDQEIEFGGLAAIVFPPGTPKERLPHEQLNLDYPGRAPDAAWRKAAEERIERIRKGDLQIAVVDASGKPVPDAQVSVELTRHAYKFGSNAPALILPGTKVKPINADFARVIKAPEPIKAKAIAAFRSYFNIANGGFTWSTWDGADMRISRDDQMAQVRWLHEAGKPIECVQVVYPGTEFLSPRIREAFAAGKAAEVAAAIKAHIFQQCEALAPYGHASFQIANELEGRPAYTDLMGKPAVLDWFRWADEARLQFNPQLKLMTNQAGNIDIPMSQTPQRNQQGFDDWLNGKSVPQDGWYLEFVDWIKRNVPIDHFGLQCHVGIGWQGPESTLKGLDWYGQLGLPIEITEFEVVVQDVKDPEQQRYQADYVRDFYTAVFSHPASQGITTQDFWQLAAWQFEGGSCFWDADMQIRPHGQAFLDLVHKRWKTVDAGKADTTGVRAVRGFLGDYAITVTAGGKTVTAMATLAKNGTTVTVKLP